MDKVIDILVPLLTLVQYFIPVITLGLAGFAAFKYAMNFWVESQANEWLLIIRNGVMQNKGIGLCSWTMPGDQVVKFPSLINQVNFTAQQVSAEMQGIEVTGMLVWSVFRDDDGPMNCYKFFGDDLKQPTPHVANGKIESMAVAIIRDRIANLTINDILKNRSKLRGGVKEEMQKILTGWGIWLETCEIQDVKISSRSLFSNLQTEYREAERLKAEKIAADTQNQIQEESLTRNAEFTRKQAESNNKIQNEQLVRNTEFQKKKAGTEDKIRHEQMERNLDYQKKEATNEQEIKNENLVRNTDYNRKQAENSQEIKQQQYDRDTSYTKKESENQHKVRQENLLRTAEYTKKENETDNQKKLEKIDRDNDYNKKYIVNSTVQKIHDGDQKIQITEHEAEVYAQELLIEKQKEEAVNEKNIREAELDVNLQKKRMELQAEKAKYENQLAIAKEAEQRKLKQVQYETKKVEVENSLALEMMKKEQAFAQLEAELKLKNDCYTENVLKSMILDTQKDIYSNISISDMRMVNMGGENGNQDPAGQLLGQMLNSYKTITDQIEKSC